MEQSKLRSIMLTTTLAIAVIVVFVYLIYTENEVYKNLPEDKADITITICIQKGGIPITSSWDGRLKDCRFREETLENEWWYK